MDPSDSTSDHEDNAVQYHMKLISKRLMQTISTLYLVLR